MNGNEAWRGSRNSFVGGFVAGAALAMAVVTSVAATLDTLWKKKDVTPVCFVKGDMSAFVPIEGDDFGIRWDKDEVKPMCEVKADFGRFVPLHGNAMNLRWEQEDVKPFISVKPDRGGEFSPVYR